MATLTRRGFIGLVGAFAASCALPVLHGSQPEPIPVTSHDVAVGDVVITARGSAFYDGMTIEISNGRNHGKYVISKVENNTLWIKAV